MKLGIDLGGTKIEGIVLDKHEVKWRKRVATPKGSYDDTLKTVTALVTEAKQTCGIARGQAIGIGTPGALTVGEGDVLVMKNCNSVVLNGKPFQHDLESLLGCKVNMANDANCFALAETLAGSGKSMFQDQAPESSFGVILGTGVGGGVVIRGKILNGLHSIAGEWGHNCLPAIALSELPECEKNRPCYCGRKDCIETYLSGPGLALSYQLRYGETISSEEIISQMREQDSKASDIWKSYMRQLAASLAQVINVLDPQLVILGGGMSNIDEIYPAIREFITPHIFTDKAETPIVQAKLGDSAGVFGAAYLGNDELKAL
jgi:fructokinase